MVTTMQFYSDYRPYIIKNYKGNSKEVSIPKSFRDSYIKNLAKGKEDAANTKQILNKAYKSDVTSYIKDVANTVNDFKSVTSKLKKTLVKRNKMSDDELKETVKYEKKDLIDAYNNIKEQLEKPVHSDGLKEFYENLNSTFETEKEAFKSMGLVYKDGTLRAIKTKPENIRNNILEVVQAVDGLVEDTNEVLKKPLTEHMEFKGFNYYCNYNVDSLYKNTFKLVEEGMVLDTVA